MPRVECMPRGILCLLPLHKILLTRDLNDAHGYVSTEICSSHAMLAYCIEFSLRILSSYDSHTFNFSIHRHVRLPCPAPCQLHHVFLPMNL